MTDAPSTSLMTADDLLNLPDDGWHYELVRGKLNRMTAASTRPSVVTMNVALDICGHVRRHRLGMCGSAEWGFLLFTNPDTVRAPDISFVAAAKIPTEGVPSGFWPGAPDLAVEVLSPSNRAGEILDKVADYLAAGTRLVWVIDPEARTATVFRLNGPTSRVGEDGVLDGEDVLPGFALKLVEVWVK
jgi:Uma2 family endonuclease